MVNFAFFGTSEFAVEILNTLAKHGFKPTLIITAPDKPKGRKLILTPPPVKIWAQENNIPYSQPEKIRNSESEIRNLKPDLIIVSEYGQIIPQNILNIPRYGCLNVHPSLLPKFRGPSPIQSFILSGKEKTGTTIILLDKKMDHGPILAKRELTLSDDSEIDLLKLLNPKILLRKILRAHTCNFKKPISSSINYKNLEKKLAELGGELLIKTIPDWIEGKIKPVEQNHSQATYTKKITKEDGRLDFNEPAEIIERKIRAFTPWPSAYVLIPPQTSLARSGGALKASKSDFARVIITEAEIDEKGKLKIKRVKPKGKNEMDFEDFLRGNPDIKLPK